MDVLLILGPGQSADSELLIAQGVSAAAGLGVELRVVTTGSAAETAKELDGHSGPAVVVPADPDLVDSAPASVIWYDLGRAEEVLGPTHLHGRGVWGLVWAIRHAVHRFRHPAHRLSYGDDRDQWIDVRTPPPIDGEPAVAVLLHGGFWRSVWGADLMDALAIDLAGRGWVGWNVEYRRPDLHGWPATSQDVAAGVALARRHHPESPIVVFGHSAGGQLALCLEPGVVDLAVSLAGVVDMQEGYRRGLGEGAIPEALGGRPDQVPEVYAAADPSAQLPLRTPALLVQGAQDSPDLVDFNRRLAAASGSPLIERDGDHFDVIDPGSRIWAETISEVERQISPA